MKVIGHRGAAGLAPENSLKGIKTALASGVDGIEFDIRVTVDGVIVLGHDNSLRRTFASDLRISESNLTELKRLKSLAGEPIATLDEVLGVNSNTSLLVEGKDGNWAKPLANVLKDCPINKQITVISFNHQELSNFGKLCPDIKRYALTYFNALGAIKSARKLGFDGIDIGYWTINPLVYWLAKRHKLNIIVFTVNRPWLARILKLLYPDIAITTDVPQKMQFLR